MILGSSPFCVEYLHVQKGATLAFHSVVDDIEKEFYRVFIIPYTKCYRWVGVRGIHSSKSIFRIHCWEENVPLFKIYGYEDEYFRLDAST